MQTTSADYKNDFLEWMNYVVIADIFKDVLQKKKQSIYARSSEDYLNFFY